jgi:hypothetical protein
MLRAPKGGQMMCYPLIRCLAAGVLVLVTLSQAIASQDAPRHKIGWLKM